MGRAIHLQTVGSEVIASGSDCSEGTPLAVVELWIFNRLLQRRFDARGAHWLAPIEFEVSDKALALPWISLVLESMRSPSHNSVENPRLFMVIRPGPQACQLLELVVFLEGRSEPVELALWPCGGEVVAVHGAPQATRRMKKYTRAGYADLKAQLHEGVRVLAVPSVCCFASAVHMAE